MTNIMKEKLIEMLTLHCKNGHEFNNRDIWVSAWCSYDAGYDPNIRIHDSMEEAVQRIYDILIESYIDELDWVCDKLSEDCSIEEFTEKVLEMTYDKGFYYNFC